MSLIARYLARGPGFRCARESIAWIIAALAVYGAYYLLSTMAANAGTCRIYGDGEHTVEACDNGSFETWDSHGRHKVYGDQNGGFEKYPGQDGPVFEKHEGA